MWVIAGDAADLLFRPDEPVAAALADEWRSRAGVALAPEAGENPAVFAQRLAAAAGLD